MDHAIDVCSPPLPLQRQLEIVQIMVYLVQVSQTFHESGPQVSVALPETVGVLYAFFFFSAWSYRNPTSYWSDQNHLWIKMYPWIFHIPLLEMTVINFIVTLEILSLRMVPFQILAICLLFPCNVDSGSMYSCGHLLNKSKHVRWLLHKSECLDMAWLGTTFIGLSLITGTVYTICACNFSC